jgi:hypothetical protein
MITSRHRIGDAVQENGSRCKEKGECEEPPHQ